MLGLAPQRKAPATNNEPVMKKQKPSKERELPMNSHARYLLQPVKHRLETFLSDAVKLTCTLAVVASLAHGQMSTAAASESLPKTVVPFDIAKLAEIEVLPGTGILLADLGELAPVALDLLARGVPPLGILRDLLKAGTAIKDKVAARAARAEDIARMKALEALMQKVVVALANESERQEARFEALREDNRKTHAELAAAKRQRDELQALLERAAQTNAEIAAAIQRILVKSATPPASPPPRMALSGPKQAPSEATPEQPSAQFGQTPWALDQHRRWRGETSNFQ